MRKLVVAQVNAQMPRTYGDSFIHVSQIDAVVEVSQPLCELKKQPSGPVEEAQSARNVASLIEDGACLQLGIGGIPDAVLANLRTAAILEFTTETGCRQRRFR